MREEKPNNKSWARMSPRRLQQEAAALAKKDQAELTPEEEKTLSLLRKIAKYRLECSSMLAICLSSGAMLQCDFVTLVVTEDITLSAYRQRYALITIFVVGLIVLSLILGNILAQRWRDRETLELPVPGLDGQPLAISLKSASLRRLAVMASIILSPTILIAVIVEDWQTRMALVFVVIILEVISVALLATSTRRTKLVMLEALQEIEAKDGPFNAEMVTEIDKKDREARR